MYNIPIQLLALPWKPASLPRLWQCGCFILPSHSDSKTWCHSKRFFFLIPYGLSLTPSGCALDVSTLSSLHSCLANRNVLQTICVPLWALHHLLHPHPRATPQFHSQEYPTCRTSRVILISLTSSLVPLLPFAVSRKCFVHITLGFFPELISLHDMHSYTVSTMPLQMPFMED